MSVRRKTISPTKRNGKSFYNKGTYNLRNPQKYLGNPINCVFESSWEYHFMAYCDNNPSIVRWGNEYIVIPYQDDTGKFHRYYTDFYIETINRSNPDDFKRLVVEIKPKNEVMPDFVRDGYILSPEIYFKNKITTKKLESYEYKLKIYKKNIYKWDKAKKWCEGHQMQFIILHEDKLREKGIMK